MIFKAAWVWLTGSLLTVAVIVIAAFLVLTQVRSCRDKDQTKDAAVMSERIRLDSIVHVADSVALDNSMKRLDEANRQGAQVIDRWHTVKEPVYLPPTASTHDTLVSATKRLNACYRVGDSLALSIVKIQSACGAFRDTATKSIADLKLANAHLDSLNKIGRPPKRWSVSVFAGYGVYSDAATYAIKRAPVAGIGVGYALFSW